MTIADRPIRTKEKKIRASDWPEGEDEFDDIEKIRTSEKDDANKLPANQRHRTGGRKVPESDKKAPGISKSAGKC